MLPTFLITQTFRSQISSRLRIASPLCQLWIALGAVTAWGLSANAQPVPPTELSSSIALAGQPFGVLAVEIPLPEDWDGRTPRVLVYEDSDRLFYPVVLPRTTEYRAPLDPLPPPRIGRPGGLIDRVRNAVRPPGPARQRPVAVQVYALFRGDEPLSLRIAGDISQKIQLNTESEPSRLSHQSAMEQWWQAYGQQAAAFVSEENAHGSVHRYLVSLLAQRLNLPPIKLELPMDPPLASLTETKSQLQETAELLLATDSRKDAVLQELLIRPPYSGDPPVPVPAEPIWAETPPPWSAGEVAVEELATRVPQECFYLRFGSFANYLWFQQLGERFGGDLSQAVMVSGFNYAGTARAERMLATRTTTVAKMFGDQLIKDMALFGSDLYLNDGASLGVLFQTSNPKLLKASFDSDRKAILNENEDATLNQVEISGRQISFLATPDYRIHSYLLVDDSYVLVTTSRRLVKRFIEVGQSGASLADSELFRWVRSRMPESNDYSVFGYFSPDFVQRLLGPQYQIELGRRLLTGAHLELAEIASRIGESETGDPDIPLGQLAEMGLLPEWFDHRVDGARVLRHGDVWIDSLRGGRGSFKPIADMQLEFVSPREAEEYAEISNFYQTQWGRMDPLFFGLRRFQGDREGAEQFSIEAFLAPFEPGKYGWITAQLAEPSPIAVVFPSDDMVSVQLRMQGPDLQEPYYLFGGLKDMMPPDIDETQGLIRTLRLLRSAPAYVGAWPKPDIIHQLPLGIGARLAVPDFAGYSRVIGGLWRWQDDQWSLLSFHKPILDSAVNHVRLSELDDMAQIRVSVADLQGSRLADWIHQYWWRQGWASSHSSASLLDAIHQQLKVPAPECLDVAQRLVDAKLQCPLGGQFALEALDPNNPNMGRWSSSAWADGAFTNSGKPLPSPQYQAPWLEWFRGAQVNATQQPDSLSVVGLIQIELPELPQPEGEPASEELLPMQDFNVFDLPLKLFGGKSQGKAEEPAASEPKRQSF